MNRPATAPSWFQRYLLPGFAMKAVIIGGGYATGRELAEYFLPAGPWGGLAGMMLAMLLWSIIAAATFAYARRAGALDYRAFFADLLGPAWIAFEVAYLLFVVLILAVFGASAGAIGAAMFGWPSFVGALLLAAGILVTVSLGNSAVEGVFKYVSILLYGVYALFLALSLVNFGDRIAAGFATPAPWDGWAMGGLTYASYNIIGAVVILPVARHFTSRRDAVIAGLLCGPLAMLPAILFFVCMCADYPSIGQAPLPSDVLLRQLRLSAFHLLFQAMIFTALLESGTGMVHAVNARLAHSWSRWRAGIMPRPVRLAVALSLLVGSIFIAGRFGLVALIARGYRLLGWAFLLVYVAPLLTLGTRRLRLDAGPRPSPALAA
jgi:uncharacterized membrane protein YkvI